MEISPTRRFVALALGLIVGITGCFIASLDATAEPRLGNGRCRPKDQLCQSTTTTQKPNTSPTSTTTSTIPPTTTTTRPTLPTWGTVVVPASWAYATNTGGGCPTSTSAAHDVTDRLVQLLNDRTQVPDGSTVQFAANACYRLDRTARVTNRNGLTFVGNGATFQRFARVEPLPNAGYPHWSFIGGTNITMSGMRVVGLNTTSDIDLTTVRASRMFEPEKFGSHWGDRAFEFGFGFQGTRGVRISDLSVDAVYGDGLILGGEHASTHLTTDVVATNITIDRNGRQGVAIISTERVLLDNIRILHSHSTGFDLEIIARDGHMRDIEIRNSYINAYTVAFAHSSVGAHDVYIHDNHIRYSLPSHPWIEMPDQPDYLDHPRSNWRIINNRVDSLAEEVPGIRLTNISGVEISGNVAGERPPPAARAGATLPAVDLRRASGSIVIRGNDFTGNTTVYSADAATAPVASCGNRLVANGAFNMTAPCQ